MSKYWFRKRQGIESKDLGWGWVPISWEGWLVVVGFIGLIVAVAIVFSVTIGNNLSILASIAFLCSLVGLVVLLSYIAHLKVRP